MRSYESVQIELKPDGSLRDIYVFQTNASVWNNFISMVLGSQLTSEFSHGENKIPLPTKFKEIKSLQDSDPTILKLFVEGGVQINCHFFIEDEIEMDVAPNEINANNFDNLVSFLRWLSQGIKKSVHITHENSPEEEIMVVEYENV